MAAAGCTQIDWNAVAAIATAAATLVALYIASFQVLSARKLERTRANLVASAVAPRLHALWGSLRDIDIHMWFSVVEDDDEDGPNTSAQNLHNMLTDASIPVVSTEELVALAALGNNCGNRLAFGLALLAEFAKEVSIETRLRGDAPLNDELLKKWRAKFDDVRSHILAVAQQCTAAAMQHAPTPTGEELYGAPR